MSTGAVGIQVWNMREITGGDLHVVVMVVNKKLGRMQDVIIQPCVGSKEPCTDTPPSASSLPLVIGLSLWLL